MINQVDIMVIFKALMIGSLIMGLFGVGVFALADLPDELNDIGWGSGGGCHSRYYEDGSQSGDWGGHCQEDGQREEYYCPHHEEVFSEEKWEEHFDDCPMNEEK